MAEFKDGQAQDIAVHRGHTMELPMGGKPAHGLIDGAQIFERPGYKALRKVAGLGIGGIFFPEISHYPLGVGPREVMQKQELERRLKTWEEWFQRLQPAMQQMCSSAGGPAGT